MLPFSLFQIRSVCCLYANWYQGWLSPLLPLRTVWAAVLTQVIGGGAQTVMSTLFVIIADVCPVEKRYSFLFFFFYYIFTNTLTENKNRATIFSQLGSIAFISELIGTPIGAALMSITPWLAFVLGYCVSFVGFLLAFFLPETLPAAKCVSAVSLLEESSDEDYQVGNSSASRRRSISLSAFLSVKLREGMEKLNYALVLVTENLNVGLILLSFFASCLGRQMTPLLLQYTSKRLNWSIAEVSLVFTIPSPHPFHSLHFQGKLLTKMDGKGSIPPHPPRRHKLPYPPPHPPPPLHPPHNNPENPPDNQRQNPNPILRPPIHDRLPDDFPRAHPGPPRNRHRHQRLRIRIPNHRPQPCHFAREAGTSRYDVCGYCRCHGGRGFGFRAGSGGCVSVGVAVGGVLVGIAVFGGGGVVWVGVSGGFVG